MISYEVATSLAQFFDRMGPSHDELTTLFRRRGMRAADPRAHSDEVIGKMRRVRAVLGDAAVSNPAAGSALVRDLLASLRACGAFRPGSPNHPGEAAVLALRHALDREGYVLDADGGVRPKTLENLEGAELTEALQTYVDRALTSDPDAALLAGTVKDLVEATARHVLVQATGTYPEHRDFPSTLFLAFDRLGLPTPATELLDALDRDPARGMFQALFIAAYMVNRYRNAEGTGHGRPHTARANDRDSRTASRIAGTVSELLLHATEPAVVRRVS